tara:strand:- start:23 stop:172 length:150 start_codon:yes stop_codon:yes gene_type:complete
MTEFEQDIDTRVREHFNGYLPWIVDDYSPQQMQHLYKLYWTEYLGEEDA